MYINEFDKSKSCAVIGQSAEDLFENWLNKNKVSYRKATLEEQYRHIDFVVRHLKTNKEITVDVKAPKKKSRYDSSTSPSIIWVEFVNVRGDKGWLYGDNEYTIFHYKEKDGFLCVKTKELAELCETLCCKGTTDRSSDALYKKYTRAGRKDVISMIYLSDVLKCKSVAFVKYE